MYVINHQNLSPFCTGRHTKSGHNNNFETRMSSEIGFLNLDMASVAQSAGSLVDNTGVEVKVLDKIFIYLDVPNLKSCRLVCCNWTKRATPFLLKRGVLIINAENLVDLTFLRKWMDSTIPKSYFKNIQFDRLTHASYPNTWSILGPHIKSLIVSHWWGNRKDLTLSDYEDILLHRCPFLEEIELPITEKVHNLDADRFLLPKDDPSSTSHFARSTETLPNLNLRSVRVTGISRPDKNFWRILEKSPHLKKLYLSCAIPNSFWDLSRFGRIMEERMNNLEELEIRSYANESVGPLSTSYVLKHDWGHLRKVTVECYTLSIERMNQLARLCKNTLEYLHLIWFNKQFANWPADRDQIWILTSDMEKMRHFHLEIDEHCHGPVFCIALAKSTVLPNLEELTFTIFEDGENGSEWEEGLFNTIYTDLVASGNEDFGQNQVKKRLKALTLPPKMRDCSIVQPLRQIYPQIMELHLDRPSPNIVLSILKHWTQLERLSMTLATHDERGLAINWNLLLIGLMERDDDADDGDRDGGQQNTCGLFYNGVTIANLDRLQSLKLSMVPSRNCSIDIFLLDHLLIYFGLSYLHRLQHLTIKGQRFSNSVVTHLRERLLPFCCINVKTRGMETVNEQS